MGDHKNVCLRNGTQKSVLDFSLNNKYLTNTWSSHPLVLLHDIHRDLPSKYDCKDSPTPPTLPGVRDRPGYDSQDGVSQQEETVQTVTDVFMVNFFRTGEYGIPYDKYPHLMTYTSRPKDLTRDDKVVSSQ